MNLTAAAIDGDIDDSLLNSKKKRWR